MDHETFYFDMKKANLKGHVNITKEYSARNDLNLEDMSPESWHQYVQNLATNTTEFQNFWHRIYRYGPASQQTCNQSCKKQRLCDLLTSESQLISTPQVCKNLWPKKRVKALSWLSWNWS